MTRAVAALLLLALLPACGAAPAATKPVYAEETITRLAGGHGRSTIPAAVYFAADDDVYKNIAAALKGRYPDAEITYLQIFTQADKLGRHTFEASFLEERPAPARNVTWKTRGLYNTRAEADELLIGADRPLNPQEVR